MKEIVSKITLTAVTFLFITLIGITPAQAITFNYTWRGNNNYSATGSFSYDESTSPTTFSENGAGVTKVLQSLNISFFAPINNLNATYNNVVNGTSAANYFNFNFNTVTKEIFGLIDLGGEVQGDTYLKGTVNTNLSLFQVPQSGSDVIIDSNSGSISVEAVPEPI